MKKSIARFGEFTFAYVPSYVRIVYRNVHTNESSISVSGKSEEIVFVDDIFVDQRHSQSCCSMFKICSNGCTECGKYCGNQLEISYH